MNQRGKVKQVADAWLQPVRRRSVKTLANRSAVQYPATSEIVNKSEKIAPIILAAGSSERLGRPKALAGFGEKTAIQIAAETCSGYEQPTIVLGCEADQIRPHVPAGTQVVINTKWREGQLSSLLCALAVVPYPAALLVYPVDHPLLLKQDVTQLVNEYSHRRPAESIVMPRHDKRYGHPIILSGDLRDELAGARTTREVVYRVPERLRTFEARTDAIYQDFQTEATYRMCLERFLAREALERRESQKQVTGG